MRASIRFSYGLRTIESQSAPLVYFILLWTAALVSLWCRACLRTAIYQTESMNERGIMRASPTLVTQIIRCLTPTCSDCSAMQTEAGAESTKPVHEQHVSIQPVSVQPPTTDASPFVNAAHAKETARMQQMFHDLSLSSIEKHEQIDSSAADQVEIQSLKQENEKLKIEQEKTIKLIDVFVPPNAMTESMSALKNERFMAVCQDQKETASLVLANPEGYGAERTEKLAEENKAALKVGRFDCIYVQ